MPHVIGTAGHVDHGKSALIQALVTVPATIAYTQQVMDMMPDMPTGASAPPFDVKEIMAVITKVSTMVGLVLGTLVLAIWPIVLHVWAGKLMRESAAPAAVPARNTASAAAKLYTVFSVARASTATHTT